MTTAEMAVVSLIALNLATALWTLLRACQCYKMLRERK